MRKKNSPTSSPTANKKDQKDRKASKPGELTVGQNRTNLVRSQCLSSFRLCLAPEDGKKKEEPGDEVARHRTLISNLRNKMWGARLNVCSTVFVGSPRLSDHIHGY